ncbi:hypothetical protein SDJN02_08928, partial [Cucurbita argyrosperma subsp. argyrosperma]
MGWRGGIRSFMLLCESLHGDRTNDFGFRTNDDEIETNWV